MNVLQFPASTFNMLLIYNHLLLVWEREAHVNWSMMVTYQDGSTLNYTIHTYILYYIYIYIYIYIYTQLPLSSTSPTKTTHNQPPRFKAWQGQLR